jgi:hypothetical protein
MPFIGSARYGVLHLLCTFNILLFFPSCTQIPIPPDVQQAVEPLDRIAQRLEEYGAITMSAPVLSRPDPSFAFDLNRPAADYFTDAQTRVQGAAVAFTQVAQFLALGVSAQFDPTQIAAYTDKLRQYYEDQARFTRKRDLLDAAAQSKYLAALEAASQEPDAQKRADLMAKALREYSESLAGPTQPPTFPTAGAGDVPSAASGLAKPPTEARSHLANEGKAKDAGQLLPQGFAPKLSNREALATAAGDKAVEAMFRMLGNPSEAQRFKDKVLFFGAATVAVDPGWRTRKDFAADLSVRTSLELMPARREVLEALLHDPGLDLSLRKKIADDYSLSAPFLETPGGVPYVQSNDYGPFIPVLYQCNGQCPQDTEQMACTENSKSSQRPNPLVAAVSPLTETQTLDLASSQRQITEISIALAAALRQAGAAAQAELLAQYVRSLQRDVRTLGAVGVANSYSASGGVFGYHVGPQLRGLDDAAAGNKAAEVLERQSFPVLILLGLDADNLRPLLRWNRCKQRLEVFESRIVFTQVSRWMPLRRRAPRLSELERIAWSYELNQQAVADARERIGRTAAGTAELLDQRKYILRHHAFGSESWQALPVELIVPVSAAPRLPQPTTVIPDRLTLKRDASGSVRPEKVRLAVLGPDLEAIKLEGLSVATGNAQLVQDQGLAPQLVGSTLLVTLEVSGSDPIVLKLPIDPRRANVLGFPAGRAVLTPAVLVTMP